MPFVKVAELAKMPPGTLMEAMVGGDAYAVANVDGQIYAVDGSCPHAAGPLGHGALHGDTIVCPWHAWEYNCRSGVCVHSEDLKLESFATKIEGGDVYIDVP